MPSIHGSSTSSEMGSLPAASARSMTFGDSAMNSPLDGSRTVAQLDLGEIRIGLDTFVVNRLKWDEAHAAAFRLIQQNPLEAKGFSSVSGAGLEPATARPETLDFPRLTRSVYPSRAHMLPTFASINSRFMLSDTESRSSSNRSAYTSRVMAALACPSCRWTALTFAPLLTMRLAAVCRRSWTVMRGTPAASHARVNQLLPVLGRVDLHDIAGRTGRIREQQIIVPLAAHGQQRAEHGREHDGAQFVGLRRADDDFAPDLVALLLMSKRRRSRSTSRMVSPVASPHRRPVNPSVSTNTRYGPHASARANSCGAVR